LDTSVFPSSSATLATAVDSSFPDAVNNPCIHVVAVVWLCVVELSSCLVHLEQSWPTNTFSALPLDRRHRMCIFIQQKKNNAWTSHSYNSLDDILILRHEKSRF
jgi:hypothetical protein